MTAFGVALLGGLILLPPGERPISYGRDIRPILSENCFYCHGQDPNQRKGDVRLDTQEGQRANGIVVPGKPSESTILERIHEVQASRLMPPPKSNRKLNLEQKKRIEQWIAEGAKFEGHWAFQTPVRPEVPKAGGVSHPVDAFLLAKMAEKGLKPNKPADRSTLIRRVYLDLIGLAPTPAEVDAFVKDPDSRAYEKLIDRLLANPHYGERLALPWLDAARYADSNGFQQDGDTFQWVWRDWVVKALNQNMPFDRFTIEQLAGDLLPGATPEQKIASAFNRNHLVNGEGGAIPDEQRFVIYFDRIDVTATNWLGLTMACAQCHDHKYDPVTSKDYYSLMAAFNRLSESGLAGYQSSKTRVSPPFLDYFLPGQKEQVDKLQSKIDSLRKEISQKRSDWEKKVAADEKFPEKSIREMILAKGKNNKEDDKVKSERDKSLTRYFEEKVEAQLVGKHKAVESELNNFKSNEVPKVMVMADDKPRDTFLLNRGEYLKPGDKVSFATPSFLPPLPKNAPQNRLGLAQWLVSPDHPLTSRVAVNRMWQYLFGTGLVKTAEDFGVQSAIPVHQDLLDWLAVEFREKGWDMKAFYKLLLTSAAYKQSSKVHPDSLTGDPENQYLTRFPRVRLPSLILRDIALQTSGLLVNRIGGKPVYPYQPDGIWETLAITKERDFTYPASSGQDLYRRSLYTFWRRTVGPANMFDVSNRQNCRVRSGGTNTPLHALTTLNDITWNEASRVLAAKLIKNSSHVDERVDQLYQLILARKPSLAEKEILKRVLEQQLRAFGMNPAGAAKTISVGQAPVETGLNPTELAAWTELCLAIYNLDEALTRE